MQLSEAPWEALVGPTLQTVPELLNPAVFPSLFSLSQVLYAHADHCEPHIPTGDGGTVLPDHET